MKLYTGSDPRGTPFFIFLGSNLVGLVSRPRPPHETRRRDRGFLQGSRKPGASAPSTTQLASPGRGREAGRGPQPGEAPSKEVQSPKSAPGRWLLKAFLCCQIVLAHVYSGAWRGRLQGPPRSGPGLDTRFIK